jgi:hypothetical protein
VTPARVKRPPPLPRRSGPPRGSEADDADQLTSGTRIKRAAVDPESQREAIEASIDAALKELDALEAVIPRKKGTGRRVPPFPGTGQTQAVPPLPTWRPTRSARPKPRG